MVDVACPIPVKLHKKLPLLPTEASLQEMLCSCKCSVPLLYAQVGTAPASVATRSPSPGASRMLLCCLEWKDCSDCNVHESSQCISRVFWSGEVLGWGGDVSGCECLEVPRAVTLDDPEHPDLCYKARMVCGGEHRPKFMVWGSWNVKPVDAGRGVATTAAVAAIWRAPSCASAPNLAITRHRTPPMSCMIREGGVESGGSGCGGAGV